MTNYLSLMGTLIASSVALWIATMGWRKADQRAQEDKANAVDREQAALLADLLELHFDAAATGHLEKNDAKMKAVLLRLPGHLATTLRVRLRLGYTMDGVRLDPATAKRLGPATSAVPHDAGHKWLIFDRSSVLKRRAFRPYPEWIEAELAYDIAGKQGGDQEAVLVALSKDVRDPKDAAVAMLQKNQEQS